METQQMRPTPYSYVTACMIETGGLEWRCQWMMKNIIQMLSQCIHSPTKPSGPLG